eukprot:6913516-Lingulodinium_polyedra.AAC.1
MPTVTCQQSQPMSPGQFSTFFQMGVPSACQPFVANTYAHHARLAHQLARGDCHEGGQELRCIRDPGALQDQD